jgi:hypothetical protein
MYPHERSLVQRLAGKPFAIVGVNSDADREHIKQRMKEENITWPSFWNNGTEGEISKKWNVFSWPTTYVIDAKGVIRQKEVRGQELDDAIDGLLKEMGVTVDPHPPATQGE